ncbi:MAG TPA: hypothetical protein VNA04_03445 [Thermoanaerobaculia bacterium]|nr:hypothetical protein [Thermoanaerobaculia bacterium]
MKPPSPLPDLTPEELTRSLEQCTSKLLEIHSLAREIEPGQIRDLLLAAASRLQRRSDLLRSHLEQARSAGPVHGALAGPRPQARGSTSAD